MCFKVDPLYIYTMEAKSSEKTFQKEENLKNW